MHLDFTRPYRAWASLSLQLAGSVETREKSSLAWVNSSFPNPRFPLLDGLSKANVPLTHRRGHSALTPPALQSAKGEQYIIYPKGSSHAGTTLAPREGRQTASCPEELQSEMTAGGGPGAAARH